MAKKAKDEEQTKTDEASDGSIAVNDAWTGMLAVSFLALAIGSGFLFYDWYFMYPESEPPKLTKFNLQAPGQKAAPAPAPKLEQPKDGDKKADAADKKGA